MDHPIIVVDMDIHFSIVRNDSEVNLQVDAGLARVAIYLTVNRLVPHQES